MKQQGNIFLIGFMGAGKSTIAAGLGEMLEMERVEMDQMIVRQQGGDFGAFLPVGEAYFRVWRQRSLRFGSGRTFCGILRRRGGFTAGKCKSDETERYGGASGGPSGDYL